MSLIAPRRAEQADEAELDEEHNQMRLRSARAANVGEVCSLVSNWLLNLFSIWD